LLIYEKVIKYPAICQFEASAKLRPLADLMRAASLTLQRHMSGSNLSPRNISNIPAGKFSPSAISTKLLVLQRPQNINSLRDTRTRI